MEQAGEATQPSQRLTAADTPGHARALRTVQVEDVQVDESDPTLGVALEAAEGGMVWVLVNPQRAVRASRVKARAGSGPPAASAQNRILACAHEP